MRAETVDTGALYERANQFIASVVAAADETLRLQVPATPAWSVQDAFAHVVGLAADLNAQRFPAPADLGGTAWTAGQVERARCRTIGELIAEWDREAQTFEDGLRAFGYETGSHFVADLHAHYQDVRSAIGLPRDADDLTVRVALDHYLGFIDEMLSLARWGTLDVVAGGEARRLGAGREHEASVRVEPFELLRAVSGRRSARQIRAFDWEGNADELLALLLANFTGGYSVPAADLVD